MGAWYGGFSGTVYLNQDDLKIVHCSRIVSLLYHMTYQWELDIVVLVGLYLNQGDLKIVVVHDEMVLYDLYHSNLEMVT